MAVALYILHRRRHNKKKHCMYDNRSHGGAELASVDKYELYERSVQSPAGDISYLKSFYRAYVGLRVSATHSKGLIYIATMRSGLPVTMVFGHIHAQPHAGVSYPMVQFLS